MTRTLFLTLVVVFSAMSASAQTSGVKQAFDEATRQARAGQFEKALEGYREAVSLSGNEKADEMFLARVRYNMGVCLYQLGQPEQAVGEYEQAVRFSGGTYQKAFYALGMAQRELKNWRAAETAFRQALDLDKKDGEAWFDLGMTLLEMKNFEAAEKAFRSAIKYESVSLADAHNNIGVICALRNEWRAAEEEFRAALSRSNGRSVEAGNNLKYCESYRQNEVGSSVGKLEFGGKSGLRE